MAFIANTMFETKVTNAVFDETLNVAGKYQASSADADCSAGLLCVRASLLPNEGYSGIYNTNAYIFNAAAATDITGIYACNPFQVQEGSSQRGNVYKIGAETLGLGIPAGEVDTFTEIEFDNKSIYRFGIGNLSAAISTNTYFTIANGLLVPAAAAPKAGTPYFKLVGSGVATEGAYASMTYYDVMACRDVNVAA
jgi:hypothetical protein